MGIKKGGNMAILAGVGPMGLGAIDYALHCNRKPRLLVVTDIDDSRLKRAESIYSINEAEKCGVKLNYVNTKSFANPVEHLKSLSNNTGFDDVFVFAPVKPVIEQGDQILGFDGCLNFFAGPADQNFKAEFNFYNVHYAFTHIVGTSGGNTDDMKESLDMMSKGLLNPAVMITHIGGMDAVIETTKHLPEIPGGKKLMYTNISLPLTAIDDFAEKGKQSPLFNQLDILVKNNNGNWSKEAEQYLLTHASVI
jgi:threonine dehydrogenase-like Zn-dependent dehydrogenase